MITEEQAREAASRIPARELTGFGEDVSKLVLWAALELARREAERIERDKPIDAEWCVANGATKAEDGAFSFVPAQPRYAVKHHPLYSWTHADVRVDWDEASGVAIVDSDGETVCLPTITTRGQLLDLLAALKGGA